MRRALKILILMLLVAFLFSNGVAIERVQRKDTSAAKEQKEEPKPAPSAPEKKEAGQTEKGIIKPEPGSGEEQPREGEVKKPQKEKDEGLSRILRGLRKGIKEEGKDRYDYFIDKNGNGIDDRLEQQGKTEKKPEERKTPPEKRERRER